MESQPNFPLPDQSYHPNHHIKVYVWIALVVAAVLVAINGYLYFLKLSYLQQGFEAHQEGERIADELQKRRLLNQAQEPSDIPSDWKTYRNEEYGFEFKYPAEFSGPTQTGPSYSRLSLIFNTPPTEIGNRSFIIMGVYDEKIFSANQGDLYLALKKLEKNYDGFESYTKQGYGGPVYISKTIIDNRPAIDSKSREIDDVTRRLIFSNNGFIFIINKPWLNYFIDDGKGGLKIKNEKDTNSGDYLLFSRVLSTFRFIVLSNVYDIKDLGIRFTLPASLHDLKHHWVRLGNDQALNSVEFSSDRLIAAGCSLETAPLGYLTYNNNQEGVVVAHARGSDLYYIKPRTQCGGLLQDWQTLQEALKSIVTDYVQ